MTYTIRDNNGNEIFSVENTTPTTPEVSFESINNNLRDIEEYSNKLNKSIEAYNLISDTRAMEALGYVKGAGFKDNVKNISHEIWKKIGEFFGKIYEHIVDFINKIRKKIVFLKDESELKMHTTNALKYFKLNKDFSNEEEDLKDIHKKIIAIYKNESLRKSIIHFEQRNSNLIVKDRKELRDTLLQGFELCNYMISIIDNNIVSKINKLIEYERLLEYNKNQLERFEKQYEEFNESVYSNADKSLKTFAIDFIFYLSSESNTLNSIKNELSRLDWLKSRVKSFEDFIKSITSDDHYVKIDKEFEEHLDYIKKYFSLSIKILSELISEITKEETTYIKIMEILR